MPKVSKQAQRFLGAHAALSNLFNLGRHFVFADHYRNAELVRSLNGAGQLREAERPNPRVQYFLLGNTRNICVLVAAV